MYSNQLIKCLSLIPFSGQSRSAKKSIRTPDRGMGNLILSAWQSVSLPWYNKQIPRFIRQKSQESIQMKKHYSINFPPYQLSQSIEIQSGLYI